MKKQFIISLITACVIIAFSSCSGTINTTFQPNVPKQEFKKAFIISSENSGYIRQKFPIITPLVVVFPGDDPAEDHKTIGNTAEVIKQELEKRNIVCTIGKRGETPENTDLIVMYSDVWRWDMKKILDNLVVVFVTPDGKQEISRSTYKIYSRDIHNFPTPEKEVPKMMKQLFHENTNSDDKSDEVMYE